MNKKVVVFDLGGVVVSRAVDRFYNYISDKHKIPKEKVKNKFIEIYEKYNSFLGCRDRDNVFELFVKELNIEDNYELLEDKFVNFFEINHELLVRLKSFNDTLVLYVNMYKKIWNYLNIKYHLDEYFDYCIVSSYLNVKKEDIDLIKVICRDDNLSNYIFVDDLDKNWINARNSGASFIKFNNNSQLFDSLDSLLKIRKAIVFDFDGVIVNTYENHYQSYKKKYVINRDMHKKLFEGNVMELRSKLDIHAPNVDVKKLLRKHLLECVLDQNVLKVLKELEKKHDLFIITSHSEQILKEFFKKEDQEDLFDEILGVETHKKKDFKFKLLFKKYNLSKDDVIFVTDTLGDILEANKLNIKTIGVDFGFHEFDRLKKGNPHEIISRFEDILKVVNPIVLK